MTQNRRIVLNIMATYVSPEGVARVAKRALCGVRSLYALVIGLFCGRWALMRLRDIIRESFVAEVHPDYIKVDGKRSPDNGINPLVEIWVLYGCASFADFPCRVKTTLKRLLDNNFPSKAYSYEISNIEILRGTAAPVARPSNKISMDVSILLNGVCDVNGVPLLDVCEIENTTVC